MIDFHLDAEKALRALKGRNICGEAAVSITAVVATDKNQHVQKDNNENITKPIIAENVSQDGKMGRELSAF